MTKQPIFMLALASFAGLHGSLATPDDPSDDAPRIAPRFAPADESSFRADFDTRFDFELSEVALGIDGQDLSMSFSSMTMRGDLLWRLGFEDRFGLVDSRLTSIERKYDQVELFSDSELLMTHDAAGVPYPLEMWGWMERERLEFEVDAETGEWETWLPKGSPFELEHLTGLVARADLAELLPPEGQGEDEVFAIPLEALNGLLFPGGNPACLLAPKEWIGLAGIERPEGHVIEHSRGEFTGEWVGRRAVDGRILEVIELELDATIELDPMPILVAAGSNYAAEDESDEPFGQALTTETSLEARVWGSGELLWDPVSGTFAGLAMDLESTGSFDLSVDIEAFGRTWKLQLVGALAGEAMLRHSGEYKDPSDGGGR